MDPDLQSLAKQIFRMFDQDLVNQIYCIAFIGEHVTEENAAELLSLVPEKLMPSIMEWVGRMRDDPERPTIDPLPWPTVVAMKEWYHDQIARGVPEPDLSVDMSSPKILEVSPDTMRVAGVGRGDGFKMWPGNAHRIDVDGGAAAELPWIELPDVQELLNNGSEVVVLSTGMHGRIQIAPEALDALAKKNVPVHVAETPQAAEIYSRLASENVRVGAIFYRVG